MKFRPILFQTAMVQAILAGRKTQTRRIIKNPERLEGLMGHNEEGVWCPHGGTGDGLWVRETWTELVDHHRTREQRYVYKADSKGDDSARQDYIKAGYPYQWKPSLFMPRQACRLFLELVSVRAERLQDISEADAIAEGIEVSLLGSWKNYLNPANHLTKPFYTVNNVPLPASVVSYSTLWESINGTDSWDVNPWVWVEEFKVIDKPADWI